MQLLTASQAETDPSPMIQLGRAHTPTREATAPRAGPDGSGATPPGGGSATPPRGSGRTAPHGSGATAPHGSPHDHPARQPATIAGQAAQDRRPGSRVSQEKLAAAVRTLAAAAGRGARVDGHLSGRRSLRLSVAEQQEVIGQMLTGPTRYRDPRRVLRLLDAADMATRIALAADGTLFGAGNRPGLLDLAIGKNHMLRGELDALIGRWFEGGRRALATGNPTLRAQEGGEFDPSRLGPALDGVGLTGVLDAERITSMAAALEARSKEEIAAVAGPLHPLARAELTLWLAGVTDLAGLVAQVAGHLTGLPQLALNAGDLRTALTRLVDGSLPYRVPEIVLRVLERSPPAELDVLFAAGQLPGALLAAIPGDHPLHPGLELIREDRYGADWPALIAGQVTSRPLRFSATLISDDLRGLGRDIVQTPEQVALVARVLADRTNDRVLDDLGLTGEDRTAGEQWLAGARAAIADHIDGWVERVRLHRTGNPVHEVPAAQKTSLVWQLLADPQRGARAAMALLATFSPAELQAAFRDGLLFKLLTSVIPLLDPAVDPLASELKPFFGSRFIGGQQALANGQALPRSQPGRAFGWEVISSKLRGIDSDRPPAGVALGSIAVTVGGFSAADHSRAGRALITLSLPQRERAAWLLQEAHSVLVAGGAAGTAAVASLERLLAPLQRGSRQFPGTPIPATSSSTHRPRQTCPGAGGRARAARMG